MKIRKSIRLRNDQVVKVTLNLAPFSVRITCCDCGLTHDVKILKYEGLVEDEVEMIFHRNRRSTAINRRLSRRSRD